MIDGQHQEGSAARTFGDDGDEARVDGAEVIVMNATGDGDTIIAVLFSGRLPKHVAILGTTVLRTPCHLD